MGSKTCCEILLKAGADVNAVGGEFGTAIQAAIYARRLKIVRLLLEAGADVLSESTISGFYGTALQAAAAADSLRIVRELLKNGALPNTSKASGEFGCALQVAAIAPKPDIAKLLLEHGANVNFTGGYHHLPIMAAAQFPRPSNLRLLLEHGADATATGGIWGSTIIAAVYGNDLECIETLISRGADVRATGGLYGCALQAAAVKADMKIIEYILDCAIDLVNHRDGKYYTPLIAAAYFDRLDVVTKLLDSGADFRHRGGQYRSVITAAAIRGNKSILEKFLGMGPDEVLLDEALVEAVAHRQSASVDLLLRSRANVFTRHPTLGTPAEALQAPEILEVNPDDEEDLKEKDGGDDDDEEKDDNDDEQWQGDDGASISGETDTGSVMDLQLEEELTETTKIQKLLAEAEARHKRNPTMKRFKSVKVRGLPQRSGRCVMPPPVPQLPSTITYAQFQPPNGSENRDPRYKQHSQTSRITPSHSESGHERAIATIAQPGYPSSFNQSQTAHPVQILARRLVQSPSDSSQHGQSLQNPQQGQYPFPASQRERQYSTGSTPQQTRSYTPPSRKGSDDPGLKRNSKVVNRRSVANLGLVGRYQHRQSSQPTLQGSTDQLVGLQELDGSSENTTFPTSTPQPARHNTYPHQQQQFLSLPPTQLQQFDQPPQWQQSNQAQQVQIFSQPLQGQFQAHPLANHPRHTSPPPQEPGQMLHNRLSQTSSPASFQSNQYANSTPRDSQISTWDTPPSVQGEFRAPDDAHRRKWGTGGYDGDGYGG
jgi:ankyrin repeat protein